MSVESPALTQSELREKCRFVSALQSKISRGLFSEGSSGAEVNQPSYVKSIKLPERYIQQTPPLRPPTIEKFKLIYH